MLNAEDEHRRESPVGAAWQEEHRVFATCEGSNGSIVVALRFAHHIVAAAGSALRQHASFQAMVSIADADPLVISEHEIDMPDRGWEFRTSGLWADHICETPLEHWSYGLEAFALAVDDPAELLGRAYGQRAPLGWELDFVASDDPAPDSDSAYSQAGTLSGIVLLAEGELEVEGAATRSHRWGTAPPVELERTMPSSERASPVALPTPDGVWWVSQA